MTKTGPYEEDELEKIRTFYPTLGPVGTAELLGRTAEGVRTKACTMKVKMLPGMRPTPLVPNPWTKEEDDLIRTVYPTGGSAAVMDHIGDKRTKVAVIARAKVLGVRCTDEARTRLQSHGGIPSAAEDLLDGAAYIAFCTLRQRRVAQGEWTIDHPISVRSVFDLAEAA